MNSLGGQIRPAQRGSVKPVGTTGLYQTSSPTAGTVQSGDLRINSGGPPNKSAKFHFDSSGHCFGGGISFGSPFGTPASTHFTIVPICASDSERSFLNFWMPTVLSICHGGICRVSTRSRMALAQGRTSSYVTSDIGAIESGLWQAWHFSCNMGAMSLVKVIVVFADSALENCGHEIRRTSANALRKLKVEPFKRPPLSCTPAEGAVYDRALFLQ